MRNYVYCFFICSFMLAFTGCQKDFILTDGIETTQPIEDILLKSYSEKLLINGNEVNETILLFNYDSKNQLKDIHLQGGDMVIEVKYPKKDQIFWTLTEDNELQLQVDFFKNSKGLVDSVFQINSDNEKFASKIIFDAGGRETSYRDYEFNKNTQAYVLVNVTRFSYDSEDNLIKSEDDLGYVIEMKYYNDLTGIIPQTFPAALQPKKGKLLKSRRVIVGGEVIDDTEIFYTFDAQKRISSIQEKAAATGVTAIKTYTYY